MEMAEISCITHLKVIGIENLLLLRTMLLSEFKIIIYIANNGKNCCGVLYVT